MKRRITPRDKQIFEVFDRLNSIKQTVIHFRAIGWDIYPAEVRRVVSKVKNLSALG